MQDEQIPFRHAERLRTALSHNPKAEFDFMDRGRHGEMPAGFEGKVGRFFRRALGRAGGDMIIGVPREIKPGEQRVALTPAGVRALVEAGHRVIVEQRRGRRQQHPRRGVHARGGDGGAAWTRCGHRPS